VVDGEIMNDGQSLQKPGELIYLGDFLRLCRLAKGSLCEDLLSSRSRTTYEVDAAFFESFI
jgi:hypothetical protein